jgi:hypothetical protein
VVPHGAQGVHVSESGCVTFLSYLCKPHPLVLPKTIQMKIFSHMVGKLNCKVHIPRCLFFTLLN